MDFLSDPEVLRALVPTIIGFIVTALASLIIGVYLEKFKGRTILLQRKITSQPIAFASKDDYWGHIRVMYNNYEAKNLNLFTVEIQNNSNRDIVDLVVDLNVDENSLIMASDGKVQETGTSLMLTKEYAESYQSISLRNQEDQDNKAKRKNHETDPQLLKDINSIMGFKKYKIPVLNRKCGLIFNLLVENREGEYPNVTANILHKSIKLVDYVDESEQNQRDIWIGSVIGLVILAVVVFFIARNNQNAQAAIIWTAILGAVCGVIGILLLYFVRFIKSFFD